MLLEADVVLDFETYYDPKNYSVAKMTPIEYVRDPRFFVHGVAVQRLRASEPEVWRYTDETPLRDWLKPFVQGAGVVAHNAVFDGTILIQHLGLRPHFWYDTRAMAAALLPTSISRSLASCADLLELGVKISTPLVDVAGIREPNEVQLDALMSYCANDVRLTARLFETLRVGFPESELELIDWTTRIAVDPVLRVDPELLRDQISEYERTLYEKIKKLSGPVSVEELRSREGFAQLLIERGIEPPMKPSPSDPNKKTYAFAKTDVEFIELRKQVPELVDARLHAVSRIQQTRAQRLLEVTNYGLEPLPVYLNYYGAHTGRWSGGQRLNLQNLPRGTPMRKAIRAPRGAVILAADLAQIEARMLACMAGHEELLDEFRHGVDTYRSLAAEIFNKPADEINALERFIGKTGRLGLGYGAGATKFLYMMQTMGDVPERNQTLEFAKKVVDVYRRTNSPIVNLWRQADEHLPEMTSLYCCSDFVLGTQFRYNAILLPNGLQLKYMDLRYEEEGYLYTGKFHPVNIWGGYIVQNVCQALARILIGDYIREADKEFQVVTSTHDEIVALAPESEAEAAAQRLKEIMTVPPSWAPNLPVDAEVVANERYSK